MGLSVSINVIDFSELSVCDCRIFAISTLRFLSNFTNNYVLDEDEIGLVQVSRIYKPLS